MRKAAKYAALLSTLSTAANVTDVRTQLEVTAYTSWIAATLDFDLQNWFVSFTIGPLSNHSQGGCDRKVRSGQADLRKADVDLWRAAEASLHAAHRGDQCQPALLRSQSRRYWRCQRTSPRTSVVVLALI